MALDQSPSHKLALTIAIIVVVINEAQRGYPLTHSDRAGQWESQDSKVLTSNSGPTPT